MEELTFRKFNEEDLDRISEFRKINFPNRSSIRSCEPEYYGWKCYRNPAQQGEMWIAEHDNAIVGIKNATPKRMKILDTIVNGAEMGDSFTHPDYQGRGICTELTKNARNSIINKGISLIYSSPNKNTQPVIQKLNHLALPIKFHQFIKLIDLKQLRKGNIKASRFLTLLIFIMAFLWPIIYIISRASNEIGTIGSAKTGISISKVSSFPEDIDSFWKESSRNYDVMLVRDREYLEWRYIKNPDNYVIWLATNEEGSTEGYLITKICFMDTVPVGYIVDFLTLKKSRGVFKRLLRASLDEFHREGASVIFTYVTGVDFLKRVFIEFGFFPYMDIPLWYYQNEFGQQVADSNLKWYFTMGDLDVI